MRREHSAGLIPFRERDGRREYLLMRDRKYWSFPKGHLEPGETELDAAGREAREEMGLSAAEVVPGFRRELRYPLPEGGAEKLAVYFPARCPEDVNLAPAEAVEVRWASLAEALPLLGFDETRQMLTDADAFLDENT